MFIEDPHFKLSGKISHGFFGRKGGVSEGLYDSLNVGYGTKDTPENVTENRARIATALGGTAENLATLYQVHSDICLYITAPFTSKNPEADAMVTDAKGLAIAVLTADCVPILFYGEKDNGAPVIGAAHAGWGGAFKGIAQSTIAVMRDNGAENIAAAIGPCIRQRSYEVGHDFMARFIEQDEANRQFFSGGEGDGSPFFDLPAYVEEILRQQGVSQIGNCGIDTYTDEENYFSYRRATHRKEKDYGRQISAIMIKP